jgi:hypothetical protein
MYDQQAQQLIADLGIERMKFALEFYASNDVPGHKNTLGLSTTHGDGITTIIQVACGCGFKSAMDTLAHELRHSWQNHIGIYTVQGGWSIWRGSTFVPKATKWRAFNGLKMAERDFARYQDQPHEVDARAYALDAYERLFKGKEPKRREKPRSVSKLDDMFL